MDNVHAAIRQAALAAVPAPPVDAVLASAVFDGFPHGLAVFGADRRLVACNDESRRLIGGAALPAAGRPPLCCTLFGCGREGSALQHLCLTERTVAEGRPLPEVRVDVDGGGATRAVWVGTSPLAGPLVLVRLRAGRADDRRRRTEPHWTAGPHLRIATLGRTRVFTPEGPLEGAWLRQRTGKLLKLLLSNRHRVTHTDEIALAFWPETERTAQQNVRHFVHGLRNRLEPDRPSRSPSSFIIARDGGYGLDLARVDVDADEFERLANEGLRAVERSDLEAATDRLDRAIALYGGEFLADEPYAEWALWERGSLHQLACRALGALAEIALEAGESDLAMGRLQQLAQIEPLDADVHQRLISLLFSSGRPGEAMRHFRYAQAAWISAFGEKPDFDMASLRRQARAQVRQAMPTAGSCGP